MTATRNNPVATDSCEIRFSTMDREGVKASSASRRSGGPGHEGPGPGPEVGGPDRWSTVRSDKNVSPPAGADKGAGPALPDLGAGQPGASVTKQAVLKLGEIVS
jgi:hypothetical protein